MPEIAIQNLYLIDDSDDEVFMTKLLFKRRKIDLALIAFSRLDQFYDFVRNDPAFDPKSSITLIDLNLTLSKGTEGITALRAMEIGPDMLLGIATGSEDPADRLLAKEAGSDFFVGKPLDRELLKQICESVETLNYSSDASDMFRITRTC